MPEINLPYGNSVFDSNDLIQHIRQSGCDYIIQAQQACCLADHTKPHSLDYWLRTNYAQQPDTKQAVNEVIEQLVGTGDFVEGSFPCPDSDGRLCKAIKMAQSRQTLDKH
jgi:hypothetical protein